MPTSPPKPQCGHCGIEFTPMSPYARYCTLRCRDAAARMRRRDRERFAPRGNLSHLSGQSGGARGHFDDDPPPPPIQSTPQPTLTDSTSATEDVLADMGYSQEKSNDKA